MRGDDDAFVRSLLADPADEMLRLVCADWLDERGDVRAEWLRIQARLAQLAAKENWDQSLVERRRQLEAGIDPEWLRAARLPRRDGLPIRNWHEFYDSLVIEPGDGEPVPKPVVSQLDRFEAEAGFRLPRSYREYILIFGPGLLLTDWYIAAPCYGDSWRYDLHMLPENMRPPEIWVGRYPSEQQDRVRRCRYFVYGFRGGFGWDPTEVCGLDAREYAIYQLTQDGRVVRFAESFRGFVENVVLEMLTLPDWDEEEPGASMRFEPATR
jgi:uncharacterized protein (TIGR02996 family)